MVHINFNLKYHRSISTVICNQKTFAVNRNATAKLKKFSQGFSKGTDNLLHIVRTGQNALNVTAKRVVRTAFAHGDLQ